MRLPLSRSDRFVLALALILSSLLGRVADARGGEPAVQAVGCLGVTVGELGRSLTFYEGLLGARREGLTESMGEPLDRLAGVFADRVRITGLRAAKGPGIELLEYLTPRDGRRFPADARPNDLVYWQTTLVVSDAAAALARAQAGAGGALSPEPVAPPPSRGAELAALARDPVGYALEIAQPGTGRRE